MEQESGGGGGESKEGSVTLVRLTDRGRGDEAKGGQRVQDVNSMRGGKRETESSLDSAEEDRINQILFKERNRQEFFTGTQQTIHGNYESGHPDKRQRQSAEY